MKNLKMEITESAREQIYQSILHSSHLGLEYVAMLAFAGLIALFGLLQNSAAVIVGAMLISPLMNPILAGALALVLGDWSLGRRAASVLAWSIGGVIALTWLVAWLTPLKQVTAEILARTNPNLLDLLVAVLAGLAGTLALRGGPVSMTIIPGVAIAVAVIPPLAVVGFSLSGQHGAMAWGGFLLFMTNLVSIMISAAVVFRLMGFAPHEDTQEGRAKLRKRMAVSALVLIILAVPLLQTLRRAVNEIGLRSEVEGVIEGGFKTGHSTIADLSYSEVGKSLQVSVTLRTTQYFETPQIEAVQKALQKRFGSDAQLMVDQVLVTQGGLSAEQMARIKDFISGGVAQHEPKEEPFDLKATHERIIDYLQKQVDEALMGTSIRCTGPVQARLGAGSPIVLSLQLVAPEPLEEQTVKLFASQLSTKVSSPVEVHGVVELEGSNYTMALELPDTQRGLVRQDRLKLTELIAMLLKRPDLQLQASLSAKDTDVETLKASRLWREVHDMLSRSRLKPSQWSMQSTPIPAAAPVEAMPSAGAPAVPKAKSSAPPESHEPVRCNFSALQDF
ncbi:MAG: TIGR00341 family protein [Terriglobia bacterium]